MDSLAFKIVDFGIQLAVILFAISFHESAHAYSALKFGDTTARDLGRISLNPIRHLDPFGSVLLPLFMYIVSSGRMIFGAAKPTPVDLRNTRNPRLANLGVSAAGPGTPTQISAAGWWSRQRSLRTTGMESSTRRLYSPPVSGSPPDPRGPRPRELGIRIGELEPGPSDSIADVEGVRVGHVTREEPCAVLGLLGPALPAHRTADAAFELVERRRPVHAPDVSIGPTMPETPSIMFDQTVSTSLPIGVINPMPVTATRRPFELDVMAQAYGRQGQSS